MMTVTLSTEEISERSQALAQYANKLIELEEEEEDVKAAHKSKMARLKERRLEISGEIRRLSRAVRLGVEERSTQQVLFDEERRMEEFRRERETRQRAEEMIERGEELIEQQQQAEAAQAERERVHAEAVARWRRERPASVEDEAVREAKKFSEIIGDEEDGGTPFPTEYPQEEINRMAGFYAAMQISEEKPVKICYVDGQPHVIVGAMGSGDAENWQSVDAWPILPLENVGEENAKTYKQAGGEYHERLTKKFDSGGDDSDFEPFSYEGVKINCGSRKNPVWWVMVGPEIRFKVDYSAAYPDNEIEAQADDFTAEHCNECGRNFGAHTQECSKSNALTFDDYLIYAEAHYNRNQKSYARKMELRRDPEMDAKVREWISQKAAADVEAEEAQADTGEPEGVESHWTPAPISDQPEKAEMRKEAEKKKKKRAKLSPVEAAIDR